jgi:adhesin/invasin
MRTLLRSLPLALVILVGATATSAQTLSVLSGDGQITAQNFQAEYPMVVVATNAAGQPMPSVTVTWTLTGPGNLVPAGQTVTDSSGQASSRFVGATIYGDTAYTQSTITASAGGSTVTFHATTSGSDMTSGLVFVQVQINSPTLGQVLSGPSGGSASTPVQAYVFGVHQAGAQKVPNVAVRLIPEDPNGPSLACAPGTGVTDQTGIANCQVVFSGPPGSGIYDIQVGGFRTFAGFPFTVTQGSTTTPQSKVISIIGGNNQSGAPGAQLPLPLTARVQNSSGNPLPNVAVVWQAGSSVSLSNVASTSDANGLVTAMATLGSTVGATQVQVRTADGAAQAVFGVTVTKGSTTPPPTGPGQPAAIRITGGNNQTGSPGARLPAPLTAQVLDGAGNPLANVPVVWQTGSTGSLSNLVSTSDANGMVSATATLGLTAGAEQVVVQAGSGGIQTPFGTTPVNVIQAVFNLTVTQGQTTSGRGQPSAIRITGGNNQGGSAGSRLPVALQAQVVDSSGNPIPNVSVTWQPGASVFLSNVASVTDANGFVSATATLGSGVGPTQVQVQAGSPGIPTPFGTTNGTFVVAIFNLAVTQSQAPTQSSGIRITGGNNQVGPPGARLSTPLTAQIVDGNGNPIPNVAVAWQPGAAVTLSNVVSISDGNGVVSAVATLGPAVGPAQVALSANGSQAVFNLTVAQSQPAQIQITGGNNQSGAPGAQLPAPLTARIQDAAGNPLANIQVVWQSVGPQPVALSNTVSTSDTNGVVSTIATLSSSMGSAQVQLRVANAAAPTALFNLQIGLTLNGLAIVTGSNQSATVGSSFPQTVTVQLFAVEGPAAGLPVQFTASGVPVVLAGGGVAMTDSTGLASITVQAGSTAGVAIVTATAGKFSGSVYLVVQAAQPGVKPLTFYNAASNQAGPISPTEVLSVYGAGIGQALTGCVTPNAVLGPLPLALSGLQVQFSSDQYSSFAPLYSVCNFGVGQQYAVVEAPADLPLGDVTVTALAGGSVVGTSMATAAAVSPGIFETLMSDGTQRAVLQRQDGSYVSLENPAQPGEQLNAFVTGLGAPVTLSGVQIGTNQAGIVGDDAPPPGSLTIQVNGELVPLISGAYSQSTIGVYVLTFAVPSDTPSGSDISLIVADSLGNRVIASNPSKIPVQ